MKIRLTFDLDERDRRAVALAFKTKRPASRTQAVQWIADLVATQKHDLLRELGRRELSPDPHQQKFPGMEGE